jgi:hypothetical protein
VTERSVETGKRDLQDSVAIPFAAFDLVTRLQLRHLRPRQGESQFLSRPLISRLNIMNLPRFLQKFVVAIPFAAFDLVTREKPG